MSTYQDGQHRSWLNGLELMEDVQLNKHVLPTGCEGIDSFLQGGLREGFLTELVGTSASGKTQVCLQVASNVANKCRGGVIYMDTSNSFSAKRIAHFICQDSKPASNQVKNIILQKVMSSISCHSVFDIFSLFDVLRELEVKLSSQDQRGDPKVRLIIVDSVSSLIAPVLGGISSRGRALMVSAGFLLKKLAHEHNLAVLVTNHTVGGEGGIPKPALGESWKSIPHVRLLLSRHIGTNMCTVSMLKHPSMGAGNAARFTIDG